MISPPSPSRRSRRAKPATSGNKYEYYNWAMACEGVGAAKIFPLANGPGTVKVVIANAEKGAASELLCQQVFDYIEERRPVGAQVEVVSAVELPLDVTAQVELGKDFYLGQVQSAFREKLAEWLQDQAFEAEDISVAHVGKLLLPLFLIHIGIRTCCLRKTKNLQLRFQFFEEIQGVRVFTFEKLYHNHLFPYAGSTNPQPQSRCGLPSSFTIIYLYTSVHVLTFHPDYSFFVPKCLNAPRYRAMFC